jgi:phosphoglycerate dehydrogenase-like enzyme
MKIVYLLKNPGIASRTPEGWRSAIISARPDGSYIEEALNEVVDADILVVGLEPVTKELLTRARKVKLIQRLGVGYDNIDVDAASYHGIPVSNMPDFNAGTVAEHTIMLMLAVLRRVFESNMLMKAGQWSPSTIVNQGIFDLRGKKVGSLGFGLIGQEVAKRVKPFEVEFLYHDKQRVPSSTEALLGAEFSSLDELLRLSDIITIHLPLTSETSNLIGKAEFEKMKRTTILINTARGAIVDESALVEALNKGIIAGAGLDVFSEEPLDPKHLLRRSPNVILTPHLAGQTREAMERMVDMMLENIRRVLSEEEPRYQVNRVQN